MRTVVRIVLLAGRGKAGLPEGHFARPKLDKRWLIGEMVALLRRECGGALAIRWLSNKMVALKRISFFCDRPESEQNVPFWKIDLIPEKPSIRYPFYLPLDKNNRGLGRATGGVLKMSFRG